MVMKNGHVCGEVGSVGLDTSNRKQAQSYKCEIS